MATVKQHYEDLLSDVYTWMSGGFEDALQRNREFITKHGLIPKGSSIAVDLGAGCGFQSIPLAEAGYKVTAIDLSAELLDELRTKSRGLPISIVRGDLLNFDSMINSKAELIVCMTDTIIHLDSKENVSTLFSKVFSVLEPGGRFVITFRDLIYELKDEDRFIPVRSDDNTVFTCFLEYEPETVKVHDIVYRKVDGKWNLYKSFFRKLRLSTEWVEKQLIQCGFKIMISEIENGFITMIVQK
jgi:SAM-dependent methyltransferase